MMQQADALELLELFEQSSIEVVVDGGWGVDALLGEQTRPHDDLDIAVQHKDVPKLRELLEGRGYKDVPRNDSEEYMFVMGDDQGHKVDVHSYTFDAKGKLSFGIEYPFDSLKGTGLIGGQLVRCIAAEYVIKFHAAYQPDENYYHDVRLLCTKFGLPLPERYKESESV